MEYKIDFKKYSDALAKNKLLGLRCNKCSKYTCPPKMTCQECGSPDLEIIQLSGKGEIRTFTQTFVAPQGRECDPHTPSYWLN